jgi:endonuclease-3 related protein
MGNNILTIYETLHVRYGDLHWWPAKTPYEIMAGAVLTQNTAWSNVKKAIVNFGDNLTPEAVLNMDMPTLTDIIRPSGFFNQKALYLKAVTEWFAGYGFDVSAVQREPLEKVRPELLSVKGVGKETADSILLYAFGFPTFVVDAYTVRLCERYPVNVGKSYDAVKTHFEEHLPRSTEIYNNFHALIVINGKDHCQKKPVCDGCPLCDTCRIAKRPLEQ